MTREEAIFILKRDNPNNIAIRSGFESLYDQRKEAFSMAIKALEQERSRSAEITQYRHDCNKLMEENERLKKALEQKPRKGYISIDDVMSVFDDYMLGDADAQDTETFLEMLKDKAESEET